jgi:hypothetical protein
VAGKELLGEQFYLEASPLKLKNIYSKWQVKNQRENSSTVPGCQPAQAQEYLQQVAGKEPEREQFYSTWMPACSSSSTASGR